MHSFALLGLLAASCATGVTAGIYERGNPKKMITTSLLPNGTAVPQPVPTVGLGSNGPMYVCHPIGASAIAPGIANNGSGPATTDTPPVPLTSPLPTGTGVPQPVPTVPLGPNGGMYVCHPINGSAAAPGNGPATLSPSGPVPATTDLPITTGTGVPSAIPTIAQGSGGPILICNAIEPNTAGNATVPSGPAPTTSVQYV